jgi:hypothetical protein
MPPGGSVIRRQERVDWNLPRLESEVGVMVSRKAEAEGPESLCWTLNGDQSMLSGMMGWELTCG